MELQETIYNNLIRDFNSLIKISFSEKSNELIAKALDLAVSKLSSMKRYDGSPFVFHSISTAMIVARDIGLGTNSVCSALLHDLARLEMIDYAFVEKEFGIHVVNILKGLCNISDIDPKLNNAQVDNYKELIVSYSTDPRVILIKMADRLEVMRSLDIFPEPKRAKKSWETLNLYSHIAHKLGLYEIKSEMEDLSLKYLETKDYSEIVQKLKDSESERKEFIQKFKSPIEEKLNSLGLTYNIKARTKSIYSIWRKMQKQKISFEEIYDVFAIRIIVDCKPEEEKTLCWQIYSIVTDFYRPNPERMRDWISIPKSNGYESLHGTVVTSEGKWVEVQIRTKRMDEVAERGLAAHWRYKGVKQSETGSEEWLARLRDLMETTDDNQSIAQKFDIAMSNKEIFVFTPNGDLRRLPEGSTVLDFAFEIHTNIGVTCVGGKVNHRNVSMKEVLKNGDLVEILTSKNQRPKKDWLNIVKSGKARSRIKVYMREQEAKEAALGREELERKLKNWKLPLTIDEAVGVLTKVLKTRTGTEVYSKLAAKEVTMADVKVILLRALAPEKEEEHKKEVQVKVKKETDDNCLVIDDTLKNVEYKLGKCCNPIHGDDIFAFTTVSAGITVHRKDCPNATRLYTNYPYRILEAKWRDSGRGGSFRATIKIQAEDTPGMLNKITEVINKDLKINIRQMSLSPWNGVLTGLVSIEVTSSGVVDMIIHSILRIKGVQKVFRVNN